MHRRFALCSRGGILLGVFFASLAHQVRADQTVYDAGDPTGEEQYILEVINRARANPVAEGTRLGFDIKEGLPSGAVVSARPPLAMNKILLGTARAHSEDMFTRNFFAHTNPSGVDPFTRMETAGYNDFSLGENIAASSGVVPGRNLEDLLMRDLNYPGRGHRVNLLDIGMSPGFLFREIGVGLKSGVAPAPRFQTLITQDFGRSDIGPFAVGVVYSDLNQNGFYDPGEGLTGVTVAPNTGAFRAVTATAGGFAFPVGTSGTITVTASGGALSVPKMKTVVLTGENVKVDFVENGAGVGLTAVLKGPVTNDAGKTYAVLGAPESGPFAGTLQAGAVKTPAIFAGDGSLRVKVGDAAPGLIGSVITKLGVPGGDMVRTTLKTGAGGVTAKDNEVLLGGLTSGALAVVARKGQSVSGLPDVTVKSILRFDGAGPAYFFLATLQGGGTTAATDSALCVAPGDGSVRVVMREGQMLGPKSVSVIGSLVAVAGTTGEARWRAKNDAFGVRVSFKDKSQQCFTVPATAVTSADWIPWLASDGALAGGLIKTLGLPGFGSTGMAAVVTLKSGALPILPAIDTVVVRSDLGGSTILAVEGQPAPDPAGVDIPASKFKTFGTPVCGAGGRTAFTAALSGVKGTAGIWYAADGVTLRQLARAGELAPGGGRWATFTQLALADETGGTPYFTGTLTADRTLGISTMNNAGLWAVGPDGQLKRVLCTGQLIIVNGTPQKLKSFTAFTSSTDSLGSAHGYDATGLITVRATFQDKTVALLQISSQ